MLKTVKLFFSLLSGDTIALKDYVLGYALIIIKGFPETIKNYVGTLNYEQKGKV